MIEDLQLDPDNQEFDHAVNLVEKTDKLIYLTGKAGSGKTTFLKHIKQITDKNTVVLAPTGVAALNAGGVTIHSFFQLPFGPFIPNDVRLSTVEVKGESIFSTFKYNAARKLIFEKLELLIIDEVSMVRCDTLDVIDQILRVYRKKEHLPFGGVQVLLIGDTFQLPPIAREDEWNILSRFYKTEFFFSSKAIEEYHPIYLELKKIYRQKDQKFIDLLNRVRTNELHDGDLDLLNSTYDPYFTENNQEYIILATHNNIVDETNRRKLQELETPKLSFKAKVKGTFPDKIMPTDATLQFKEGAQVIFIKNDTQAKKRYFNGKLGKIKKLSAKKIEIELEDKTSFEVKKEKWENVKYIYNGSSGKIEKDVIGTFEQYPLRLAWAITVHKSQGLTFEKVYADLGRSFTSGQVYVALSRCTSFEGLALTSEIGEHAIKTDPNVLEFAKKETSNAVIAEQITSGGADLLYKKAREYFKASEFDLSLISLIEAMKVRNDIDTDLFKRYVSTTLTRLTSLNKRLSREFKLQKDAIEVFKKILVVDSTKEAVEGQFDDKAKFTIHELEKKVEWSERLRLEAEANYEKETKKAYDVAELRKTHKKAYEPWTEEADQKLELLFCERKSVKELCLLFGRNDGAIRSRIKKLGLKEKYADKESKLG